MPNVGEIGKLSKNRRDLCGTIYLLKVNQIIIITLLEIRF